MARGGYRMWATTDRHQADYTLRHIRQALAKAIAQNKPEEIAVCRAAEARDVSEVERVDAVRDSLEMNEKLRRMA